MTTVTSSTPVGALPEWLRPEEAAQILRVSKGLVYSMAASGELPSRRFGRLLRIHRTAVIGPQEPGDGR